MEQDRGRIVVGVDGSPESRAALEYALRDAARRGASVQVVVAFAPPEYWVPMYGPPAISTEDVLDGVRREAEAVVREVTEQMAGEQVPPVTVAAVIDTAAHALLQAARDADLLVVGSRGRGGFTSMLLGSVGLSCVLHATCPVTVVHGAKRAAETEPDRERAEATSPAPATG